MSRFLALVSCRRGASLAGASLLLLVGSVACGGGDVGPPKGYTLFSVFETTRPGYEIARPDSWTVEKGYKSAGYTGDRFISPEKVSSTHPAVTVICDREAARSGTTNFTQKSVDYYATQNVKVTLEDKVPIVGLDGKLMVPLATFTADGYDVAQIYTTDLNCGWVLTLLTAPGTRDDYMETFLTMAETFKRY